MISRLETGLEKRFENLRNIILENHQLLLKVLRPNFNVFRDTCNTIAIALIGKEMQLEDIICLNESTKIYSQKYIINSL